METPSKDQNLQSFSSMLQFLNIKLNLPLNEIYNRIQAEIQRMTKKNKDNPNIILLQMVTELFLNPNELDTIISYNYLNLEDRKDFLQFRNFFSSSLLSIIKKKIIDINSPILTYELVTVCSNLQNDKVWKILEMFLKYPKDTNNEMLLDYLFCFVKSIKTQDSLSEIFFIQNEVENFKLSLPFLDIELHPLLLEQLLNMLILLKSYNNDLLSVSKVNSMIFDLCDKIIESSSPEETNSKSEIKIMFFVISIMQYVKLLGIIDKQSKNKEEMLYKEMMKYVEEIMKIKKTDSLAVKNEPADSIKEEINMETFDKKTIGNEKDIIKEMEKKNKELTEALANEKEKNKILKEQLNDKNNAIMKLLKAEKEKVKSLEKNLKISQNNNTELSSKLRKTNNINKSILLDAKLLSKRGYVKILIELCKVISSNQQFQQDYPILAKKESLDLLVKIKEIFNWKAHNPESLVGLSPEEKIGTLFEELRKYFCQNNQETTSLLQKIFEEINQLAEHDTLLLIDDHNKQKRNLIKQYLLCIQNKTITNSTIQNLLLEKKNSNPIFPTLK